MRTVTVRRDVELLATPERIARQDYTIVMCTEDRIWVNVEAVVSLDIGEGSGCIESIFEVSPTCELTKINVSDLDEYDHDAIIEQAFEAL